MPYDKSRVQQRVDTLVHVIRTVQPFLALQALEQLIAIPDDEIKFEALTGLSGSVSEEVEARLGSYFAEYDDFIEKADGYGLSEETGPIKAQLKYREALVNKDVGALASMRDFLSQNRKANVDFLQAVADGDDASLETLLGSEPDTTQVRGMFSLLDHFGIEPGNHSTVNTLIRTAYEIGDKGNGDKFVQRAFDLGVREPYVILAAMVGTPNGEFNEATFETLYAALPAEQKISILEGINVKKKGFIAKKIDELKGIDDYAGLIRLGALTGKLELGDQSLGFYKRALAVGDFKGALDVAKKLPADELPGVKGQLAAKAKEGDRVALADFYFSQELYDDALGLYRDVFSGETSLNEGLRMSVAKRYSAIGRVAEAVEFITPVADSVSSLEEYVGAFRSVGVKDNELKDIALAALGRFKSEDDFRFIAEYFNSFGGIDTLATFIAGSEELKDRENLGAIVAEFGRTLEEIHSRLDECASSIASNLSGMYRSTSRAVGKYQEAVEFVGRRQDSVSAERLMAMRHEVLDSYASDISNKTSSYSSSRNTSKAAEIYQSAVGFIGESPDGVSLEKLTAMRHEVLGSYTKDIEGKMSSNDPNIEATLGIYLKAEEFAGSEPDEGSAELLNKARLAYVDVCIKKVNYCVNFSSPHLDDAVSVYQATKDFASEHPDTDYSERLETMRHTVIDGYEKEINRNLNFSEPHVDDAINVYQTALEFPEPDGYVAEALGTMQLNILDGFGKLIKTKMGFSTPKVEDATELYQRASGFAGESPSTIVQNKLQELQSLIN